MRVLGLRPNSGEEQLPLGIRSLHPAHEHALHFPGGRPECARTGAPNSSPSYVTYELSDCESGPQPTSFVTWAALLFVAGIDEVECIRGLAHCPMILGCYCHQLEGGLT